MPIAAPTDKRFRRARATPARRARLFAFSWGRAARAAVLLAVVGAGLYRGTTLVLSAEALTITRITVSGNSHMSRGEVLALLDGVVGQSVVTADLESWRQRLLGSPWVADAAIRRRLPGTVAVVIVERRPMAVGRLGDGLYLIDDRGEVIDQFGPAYAEFDLPIVEGLADVDGTSVDPARADLAARVLAAFQGRPDLAGRLSEVDVSDVRDAVVLLKGDTAQVRLGTQQFAERLQSYLDLVPALRERMAGIDYVDLRFDERVYVRPQTPGHSSPRPATAGTARTRTED